MGDIMWLNLEISRRRAAWAALLVLAGCPAPSQGETDAGSGESSDTSPQDGVPAVCARWAECSAAIDPDTSAEIEAEYGAGGSCWEGDEATQAMCVARCDSQLRSYGTSFPDEQACRFDDIVGTAEFLMGEAMFDPDDPLAEPVYRELAATGDEIKIVRGGQGLLMLPLAVRGRGFEVPADPLAWDDPKMPQIDLWIDVEGHNVGFGGHFTRLNNYPIGFVPVGDDGTLEHLYIAIIIPDAIPDPQTLTGQPGLLHAELRTWMQPTVTQELQFTVAAEIQEM
jgi:hypothetical protein